MKRFILIILGVAGGLTCLAQPGKNGYELTGHIPGTKDGKIYLTALDENRKRDSAIIRNGAFRFTGKLEHPVQMVIFKPGLMQHPFLFFGENSKMTIVIDTIDAGKINVTGSVTQRENEFYEALMKPIHDQLGVLSILERGPAKTDPRLDDSVGRAQEKLYAIRLSQEKAFIRQYPRSYVSGYLMVKSFTGRPDPTELEEVYNALSPALKHASYGKKAVKRLKEIKEREVGTMAPDFTQMDTIGNAVSLKDFKGKYVFLDFWASWCVPCRRENQVLLVEWQQLRGKNLAIISVSADNNKKAWLDAIRKDRLNWIHVSDLSDENEVKSRYNVVSMPANFLIDPNGKIIAKNIFGEEMKRKLAEVATSPTDQPGRLD